MRLKKIISGLTSLALSLTMLAGVEVQKPTLQTNAATTSWKFDLGATSTDGYTSVAATYGYTSDRGYGFSNCYKVENQSASGSGALSDAVRFTEDGGATFNVDVPTGLYEVKVYTGNVTRMSVQIEGMLQIVNITGYGTYDTVVVPVTDGTMNIGATPGRSGWKKRTIMHPEDFSQQFRRARLRDRGEYSLCGVLSVRCGMFIGGTNRRCWRGTMFDASACVVKNIMSTVKSAANIFIARPSQHGKTESRLRADFPVFDID